MTDIIKNAKSILNLKGPLAVEIYTCWFKANGTKLVRIAEVAEETIGDPDWIAARIRECENKGAGAIGEYITAAFNKAKNVKN
jgi:hypothetical protein